MAVQATGSTFTFLWGLVFVALYLLFFGITGRLYLAHSCRLAPYPKTATHVVIKYLLVLYSPFSVQTLPRRVRERTLLSARWGVFLNDHPQPNTPKLVPVSLSSVLISLMQTPNPKPQTPNPTPQTANPTPYTLNPEPPPAG